MLTAASLLASILLVAAEKPVVYFPKGFDRLFEEREFRYTGGPYQDQLFRYRLFVPRNPEPAERFPLLVWLHGAGENGSDNQKSLRWLDRVLDAPSRIEQYRFFILVVQCPGPDWFSGYGTAEAGSSAADDMLTVTFAVLEKTLREQPIDPDRVYLSGVSSGAGACWELAMRHPEVFAALVPMGSGGGDLARAERLTHIPVWAFHNVNDEKVSRLGDEQMVAAVNQAGGNALLTLHPTDGHDCWQEAFVEYGIMAWLLDQRRDAWLCWTPPGSKPWRWWHVFGVPGAFLLLVTAGLYSEQRRRQRKRAQPSAVASGSETVPGQPPDNQPPNGQ